MWEWNKEWKKKRITGWHKSKESSNFFFFFSSNPNVSSTLPHRQLAVSHSYLAQVITFLSGELKWRWLIFSGNEGPHLFLNEAPAPSPITFAHHHTLPPPPSFTFTITFLHCVIQLLHSRDVLNSNFLTYLRRWPITFVYSFDVVHHLHLAAPRHCPSHYYAPDWHFLTLVTLFSSVHSHSYIFLHHNFFFLLGVSCSHATQDLPTLFFFLPPGTAQHNFTAKQLSCHKLFFFSFLRLFSFHIFFPRTFLFARSLFFLSILLRPHLFIIFFSLSPSLCYKLFSFTSVCFHVPIWYYFFFLFIVLHFLSSVMICTNCFITHLSFSFLIFFLLISCSHFSHHCCIPY